MPAWFGLFAVMEGSFGVREAVELGALALLTISSILLWRKAAKPARKRQPEGLPLIVAAAATAALIDEPHRIVEVVEVGDTRAAASSWSLEGRRAHFASHRLR